MTDRSDSDASQATPSIPQLNLELERARIELRETIRELEDRVNLPARYRRWRDDASGADDAFPVAIVAGVVILGIAAFGIVRAVRDHR